MISFVLNSLSDNALELWKAQPQVPPLVGI